MPSQQHTELTRRALCWLSNIATQKGIRGCPEITLCEGYVADAGAILNLQYRWFVAFCGKGFNREIEFDDFTFIVESKASKSDFRKTFVKNGHGFDRKNPKANFHFVVVSNGVLATHLSDEIGSSEVPDFWGILEESRHGLRLVRSPKYCPQSLEQIHEFGYRILRYADPRKYMIMGLKEEPIDNNVDLFDRNNKISLLENYSTFLAANGYMDEDWRSEPPYAIDEFLKLKDNE